MTSGSYRAVFARSGFRALLASQFLGTLNDNLFKIAVTLYAVNASLTMGDTGSLYLAIAGGLFILPYLLFSGYAGQLADRHSKRTILIITKACEIGAMSLAVAALATGRVEFMFGVLFLMATQSTFFSPAKYGILPEIFGDRDISRANGLFEMTLFIGIVLGTTLGGILFDHWSDQLARIGYVAVAIAVVGTALSFNIPRVSAPAPALARPFDVHPWREIGHGVVRLHASRPLWLTVLGLSFFWFLAALVQMDIILLGKQVLALDDTRIGLLQAMLAIGVALGSITAGRLSGDHVELGLVPLGSIGFCVGGILLGSADSFAGAATALILLGFSGGFYAVPLNAFLQSRSDHRERGRLIATNNFLNMAAVLVASATLWLLRDGIGLGPDHIAWVAGALTALVTIYLLHLLPDVLVRFLFWMLTHTIYRIRIEGREHIPATGPALLVCNHVSFIDGFLVNACIPRIVRYLVAREQYERPGIRGLMRLMHAIPIDGRDRKQFTGALDQARAALRAGEVVCIFAEGSITRTGNMLPFKRGVERIADGLDIPIVPVHLDRVWGSVFSFKRERFFTKWPERLPYPVTVSFGAPMPANSTAWALRQAIQELGTNSVAHRRTPGDLLHLKFVATAKRRGRRPCIADSTGQNLSFGRTLVASLVLAGWVRKHCRDQRMVGLLLPASVGGALANIALSFAGKVPVNLNFTTGPAVMAAAIDQCGIRTVLTSRVFLAKAKLDERPDMMFIEDILKQISPVAKLAAAMACRLLPARLIGALYSHGPRDPFDLATVIFSSGSTGEPKGVMLSHHAILSNVEAAGQALSLTKNDTVMGVLPLFHSFGFTGTLWTPLITGVSAVFHPNPLDAKTIGELVARHQATILISTPTFCQSYIRTCAPDQFASLRVVIVGAEKLRAQVADAFKAKFGIDLQEGYGCTEMGPVVSTNLPDVTHMRVRQTGSKPGTVGHPLPGVSAKVVNVDTGAVLPPGQEGLLMVKGPGRMDGYLGRDDLTQDAMVDGWYATGDIAALDDDGFIIITDRLARFSKIGGEMVPHLKIEDSITALDGIEACAVTAVADARKGERLVAFYVTDDAISSERLAEALAASDLPNLWRPHRRDLHAVDELPVLGTGKLDLGAIKRMAAGLDAPA